MAAWRRRYHGAGRRPNDFVTPCRLRRHRRATGGEGGIACATRAFVVTVMSILPGLLIGVVTGLRLAARRDRKHIIP
jgi:hypothetical protein